MAVPCADSGVDCREYRLGVEVVGVMPPFEQAAIERDTSFEAMHVLLLDWGLYLRGGGAIVDAARPDIIRRDNSNVGNDARWVETTTKYREVDPRFDRRD